MSRKACRLTAYFGELAKSAGTPPGDTLLAYLRQHGVGRAVLLRAGEGFGPLHGLHTSDRLTLSEDLPMVLIAVGEPAGVESAATEITDLLDEGLVTVEQARVHDAAPLIAESGPSGYGQITVWTDRGSRVDGSPAHEALCECLRDCGADAAISLLGIDGLVAATRRRAGFFSANREVPMLVSAVGPAPALERAWRAVAGRLPTALAETRPAERLPDSGDAGKAGGLEAARRWRVSIWGSGLEVGDGIDRQQSLVRGLRRAGAPGATGLQGLFGFAGGDRPHGDSVRTLRRRIPVLTEFVDTGDGCRRSLGAVAATHGHATAIVASLIGKVSRPGDPA